MEHVEVVASSLLLLLLLSLALYTTPTVSQEGIELIRQKISSLKPVLEEFSWKLVKSNPSSTYSTDSPSPIISEERYRVNVTTNIGGVLSTPLVDSGLLFLADGEGVYALNSSTGELIWGVEVFFDDLHSRAIGPLQPVSRWRALGLYRLVLAYAVGEAVYVGTDSGDTPARLIALDKKNGSVLWMVELDAAVYSNIVVTGGRVYVGSMNGTIYCISEDGEVLWSSTIEEREFVRGLAYGDNKLFVSLEDRYYLYALNAATGELEWVYEHNTSIGTPEYSRGVVVFTDSHGRVTTLTSSGRLLWSSDVGALLTVNSDSLLAISDTSIYATKGIGGGDGLVVLSRDDGSIIDYFKVPAGEIPCQPVVAGPLVILPSRSNSYTKIYVLWRGRVKLDEKIFSVEEAFCPQVSVAEGRINTVFPIDRSIQTLISYIDDKPPVIISVSSPREIIVGEELAVEATVVDRESAIYRVILAYRVGSGEWSFRDMDLARRYVVEPVGGYGFSEEPYIARIPEQKEETVIEYIVVAIDNVGNIAYSDTYRVKVVGVETTSPLPTNTTTTTSQETTTSSPPSTSPSTTTVAREEGLSRWIAGVALAVAVVLLLVFLQKRSTK